MKTLLTAVRVLALWIAGALVLWYFYGLSSDVDQGYLSRDAAIVLTTKMSLIITIVTIAAWAFYFTVLKDTKATWRNFARTFAVTFAFLFAYGALVFLKRNTWNASQGMNDYAQFLPIVGRVNAEFFKEMNWLVYLFAIVPVMSLVSAVLLLIKMPSPKARSLAPRTGSS